MAFGDNKDVPAALKGGLGFTRALYSNWLWTKPLGVMFDAGEGAAVGLGIALGAPRTLCLTHGHSDHILGLAGMVVGRQLETLISGGPLRIVYPAGCPNTAAVRELIGKMWPTVQFDRISWSALVDGGRVALNDKRDLVAFNVAHSPHLPSLGYAVVEKRRRLTTDAQALSQDDLIAQIKRDGRASVEDAFEYTLLAHTGDAFDADCDLFSGADTIVADCSFVRSADRDYPSHSSLEEIVSMARKRLPKNVVLHHVSQRYDRATLNDDLLEALKEMDALEKGTKYWIWDEAEISELGQ